MRQSLLPVVGPLCKVEPSSLAPSLLLRTIKSRTSQPPLLLCVARARSVQCWAWIIMVTTWGSFSGNGNVARVWDLQRRALDVVLTGYACHIYALAVLPDGRLLSSSGGDEMNVWDERVLSLRGGTSTDHLDANLHAAGSCMLAFVVLRGGRGVSGHYNGTVCVWR